MWVRIGKVEPRAEDEGVEALQRLHGALSALGYPRPPLRTDADSGAVYLDVGVDGAPPASVAGKALELILREGGRRPVRPRLVE